MKIKLHIPTEEYGFVEIEQEVSSIAEALVSYNASKRLKTAPTEGLGDVEWRKVLDGYLTINTMPSEAYERMDDFQRGVVQEIKKSFKRLSPEKELRVRE